MAVVVNSATQVSTVSGNGGGRINTFDVSVSFGAGDDAVTEAAILATIGLGSGFIVGAQDRGGIILANAGAQGLSPYYDDAAMEIRFANSVTGTDHAAIAATAGAHFTVIVRQ